MLPHKAHNLALALLVPWKREGAVACPGIACVVLEERRCWLTEARWLGCWVQVKDMVEDFKAYLPLFLEVGKSAMQKHHWAQVWVGG